MSEISEKEGSAAKAAAARLTEAEREITEYQRERSRWINYTTDLQRIIEALCNRRGLPEPVSTARHHYEMAREYLSTKSERDRLAERVAELEAVLEPIRRHYEVNDLDERGEEDALEIPVYDLRAAVHALVKGR